MRSLHYKQLGIVLMGLTSLGILFMLNKPYCLTPNKAKYQVPLAEQTEFKSIQLLSNMIFKEWLTYLKEIPIATPPEATEAMIFFRPQWGHGADVRLVWFKKGCAIYKDSYPAQIWLKFSHQGSSI